VKSLLSAVTKVTPYQTVLCEISSLAG